MQRCDGVEAEVKLLLTPFQLKRQLRVGVMHLSQFAIGQEVLHEDLLFVGCKPGEIGLVIGKHPGHQLDIGAVFIGQIAIPGTAKIVMTPGPLLFPRRHMVVGHVQQAAALAVMVCPDEIVVRFFRHVGGWHRHVFVAGDIHARGIIDFIVGAGGDREGGDGALAMVKYRRDVRREDALVIVPTLHRRICPPQEVARRGVAVEDFTGDLNQCPVRVKGKPGHRLQAAHRLGLVQPDGLRPVILLLNGDVDRHKGGWAMVLRPVKFDATRDPRPQQPHQRRFHHFVVVDEITLLDFVIRAMNTSPQLRQQHNADEVVFHPDGLVIAGFANAGQGIGHAVGIDRARGALIDALFQEHRVGIFCAGGPRR